MSVKKVKISELKQLPQEADASDIFVPAADLNNKTYRVPLSRYDQSKDEINSYTLPEATESTLGGIKIGSGFSMNNGVLSVDTYAIPTRYQDFSNGAVNFIEYMNTVLPSANTYYQIWGKGSFKDIVSLMNCQVMGLISNNVFTGEAIKVNTAGQIISLRQLIVVKDFTAGRAVKVFLGREDVFIEY